ncbi:MAG TPA: sulfatase [Sphingobacterium sp.]|nr:sulfatase [Sphingobacterium sp.]
MFSVARFFCLLFVLPLVCPAQQSGHKPNIVVVMADDLDSRQLSCYGGQNIRTTYIDQLASEGMKFNNMIASEAMCIPTRASLFTGLYPARHGSFQNHKMVYEDVKSICHYLGDLNYTVALTGKDHSTKPASIFPFKFIDGFEANCVAPTDDYFLDSVRSFITTQQDPFCLFIMSTNPHTPWTMGDPSEFDPEKLKLPPHWVDTRQVREQFCKYLAEVRRLDNQVGEIRQLLAETGQDKNTIFIFLGEQGAQFPGAKWNLWDEGQKSSMIVFWPGVVKPATQTDAIVQYEDIMPTFVDIAGGKAIDSIDGRSFRDVLTGKTNKGRKYAYGIHNNIPEGPPYPMRSIRTGEYKLILNLTPKKKNHIKYMMNPNHKGSYWNGWVAQAKGNENDQKLIDRIEQRPRVQFYDLKNDPYELVNLAEEEKYASLIDTYRNQLKKWMKQQGDTGVSMDIDYKKVNNK